MKSRMSRMRKLVVVDITPLRQSQDFRYLYLGHMASFVARELTVVAVPYQAFVLTGSSLVVGSLGLAQLVPGLAVALLGGAFFDAFDRKKLMWISQVLQAVVAAGLMVNAAIPSPALWPLFVLSGLNAGLSSIDTSTRIAVTPSLVSRELLPAALALNQTMATLGGAAGPAIAGVLIATFGISFSFGLEAFIFVLAALSVLGIGSLPKVDRNAVLGFRSVAEGFRYIKAQRRITSTFVIDLNAMVFAMPRALFPALGIGLFGGDASTVGLLYAAPGMGALVAASTAGWVGAVKRQGLMIVSSVLVWGVAMTLFGLVGSLPIALVLLGIAGSADVVSAVFRGTIVQLTVPDQLRGRISGVHVAVVRSGPRLGDLRAGAVASVTSEQFSVVSGGLLAILGTLLISRLYPELIGDDSLPPSGSLAGSGGAGGSSDWDHPSATELAPDSVEEP
jgi:MFS family permease